ncbi:MAG: pilus assembly FimT family protein [Gemmatimonas sp.]
MKPLLTSRRGFTLIEMLMIVVIIGFMALLVLPKIRTDSVSVDTAVRTVNLSVMVAQRDAVSRQHNVIIAFDTIARTVRTVWDANNNGIADMGERAHPFLLPSSVILGRPGSVPKLGGASEITPVPRGTSRGPLFIMMRSGGIDRSDVVYFTTKRAMTGKDKDVRALAIARATGRAVWYKWSSTGWKRG